MYIWILNMIKLVMILLFFFFNDTTTTEIYTLSLHDALPIYGKATIAYRDLKSFSVVGELGCGTGVTNKRSEEHTSELQSRVDLVCRLLLEKKKKKKILLHQLPQCNLKETVELRTVSRYLELK